MKTFPFVKRTPPRFVRLAAAALLAFGGVACGAADSSAAAAENGESAHRLAADAPADGRGKHHGKGPHGMHGRRGPKDPAALIERFDANDDGKLAVAELPERLRGRLGSADSDKDGFLSVEELKAKAEQHRAKIAERRAKAEQRGKERFARKDANSDGALTEAEVGERAWTRLKVADQNGDGQVTRAELQEARASGKLRGMHPRREGHRGGPAR